MEKVRKNGVVLVVDPQLHNIVDAVSTVEKLLDETKKYRQPIDFVVVIDNGNQEPFTDALLPPLKNNSRLSILRIGQRSTVGNCLSHATSLFKIDPPPTIVVLNPGTELFSGVFEAANNQIDENPDEVSVIYGDVIIDGQKALCNGFDRSVLMHKGHIAGPIVLNMEAVFKLIEDTKQSPFDTNINSFSLLVFDLLVRLTDFSMGIHIPEFFGSMKSENISKNETQQSHEYLTKKYASPQVST